MRNTILFSILILFAVSCSKVLHITDPQTGSVKIEEPAQIKPSAEINELIAPYKNQLEAEMNMVIGTCAKDLVKEKPESSLGNWTADLIHKQSEDYYGKQIDFTIVNYGGLRLNALPKGEITRSTIFELMPFDNMLVVLYADGETVYKLFERMASYGGWPISYHVNFKIKNQKPDDISINGKPLEKNKIYKIAMSDFLANGGDNLPFFKDKKRDQLGKLFRDAILEYMDYLKFHEKQADAEIEGRVILNDE